MYFMGYPWLQSPVCRLQICETMVQFSPGPLSVETWVQEGELLCSGIWPKHRMRVHPGPEAGRHPMVTARNGGEQRATAVTCCIQFKNLNF